MKPSVSDRPASAAHPALAAQALPQEEEFARYRAAMNRLNSVLDSERSEEEVLRECVEAVRHGLDADRCLLASPGDPASEAHTAPICAERPGAGLPAFPRAIPVSGEAVRAFLMAFADAQEPVALGPSDMTGFDAGFLERNGIGVRLIIPIRPKSGQAWWLALHDSDRDRIWTPAEKRLFQDMAARIKSGLGALLTTRDLRRNQAFGNLLTEMLPQLLWTSDANGRTDFVNRRMREFTGLEDLERIGRAEHMHPADMAAERERLAECIRDCAPYEGEMRIRRRDGEYVWHLVRSAPLLDAQGRLERRVGTCTDISESKRLLNALARSKEELEAIIGGVDEGISAQDATGRIIYANRKFAEISGYPSPEALLAAPLQERVERFRIFDEEGRPVEFDRLPGRRVLNGESHASLIMRFEDMSLGRERWVHAKSAAVADADGRVIMAINFSQDITEARLARGELVRSREQLAAILAGITDAIIAQKPDGRLVYANEAAARQLGFPSSEALIAVVEEAVSVGRPNTMEFFDEEGRPLPLDRIPSRLARQGIITPPTLLRFKTVPGAKERWVISQARPLFDPEGKVSLVISMSQDITELREKEETVRRLQKMESLGKLAGGIAHDFNNLLVSINGYSDLGARIAEAGDPILHEYFAEIRKSGERAASLTQQLLAYGRKQMVQPRALDLNVIVSDMQKLLLRLIGEDVRLRISLADGLPSVKADSGQMEQVIMNLALNARDAMPAGGVVRLETAVERVEEGDIAGRPDARPGLHAVILVADTGTGIDPAIRDRIFEPFFTTKEAGLGHKGRSGTGLGLASVYSIVDQWGGHIRVDSDVGKGTVFRILLPAIDQGARVAAPGPNLTQPSPASEDTSSAPEKGTVLLVEEAEAVLRYARHILESEGFAVLTARSGAEALAAAERAPRLDLLLVDVETPDIRGPDLIDRIRAARPDLKAVLMSGYREPDGLGPEEPGRTEFLWKPFAPEELAFKARRLLARGPVPK